MALSSKEKFGLKLRALRSSRDFTQRQVADAINRSPETVSNIERGVSAPTLEVLEQMADMFAVPVGALFDEIENDPERIEQVTRLQDIVRGVPNRELATIVELAAVIARRTDGEG